MNNIDKILKDVFWYDSFRDWQREIIESVISWNDTMVFMPTWWWKSLTYQIPWIYLEWITIVISPLISLMKDQVDTLNVHWINARFINSSVSNDEQYGIYESIKNWSLKFLYIAPERLNSTYFQNIIKQTKIWLIAVDEAHCISSWWHDFRPSYMKIRDFIKDIKRECKTPVIALTATATKKVREDISERLWLWEYSVFTKWFDRKNIIILVREISKKQDKLDKIREVVKNINWAGIIYCSSRKKVDEVYDFLLSEGIECLKYTWAMSSYDREKAQNLFMDDKVRIVVATNAFWMWIDKSDIRFTIHYNLPWSIENYYQEVWRAGRDNKKSFWIILASYQDTKIQEFFIENSFPPKKDILKFYDYIYQGDDFWEWEWKQIAKTYFTMASASGLDNDMKVASIINIFEKFWIIKKSVASEDFEEFRWNGITTLLEKKYEHEIPINWGHQDLLKQEAEFKLEQIKKLLFYPSCRKNFILKYFWDEEDMENIRSWCWICDFCIDYKKIKDWSFKKLVPISAFEIVLDLVDWLENKFWVIMIAKILKWSLESKIKENRLDTNPAFWSLKEYSQDFIQLIIEALIKEGFLYKKSWQFPTLEINEKWINALFDAEPLKIAENNMQLFLVNNKKESKSNKSWSYDNTLECYNKYSSFDKVVEISWYNKMTIENHFLNLYKTWKFPVYKIMWFSDTKNLKKIKDIVWGDVDDSIKLKVIKEALEDIWQKYISYFEIKIALEMIKKSDL